MRTRRSTPFWPTACSLVTVRATAVALPLLLLAHAPVAAQEAPPAAATHPLPSIALPKVTVIGSTPLTGLGIPAEQYPGNVQSLTADDIATQRLLDLSDTFYRRLGAVNINTSQSNPWQNDVTYRGFLASPLTGSPIGLSVYLDGVRFNDGFGETVNWDLIPQTAIADVDLIPGSNPIFGLNTLGGALSVHTKRGRDFPGTKVGASGGAFGRWAVEAEHGGSRGPVDWYLAFNALNEDGWRAQSPSALRQLFAAVGWETGGTALTLNYLWADNDLVGNGLVPESTLARDQRAVHTLPDQTRNVVHLVHLRGSHQLTEALRLAGNAFYRQYTRHTLNGDAEVLCIDDTTDAEVFDPTGQQLHLGRCLGSSVGFFDAAGNPLTGTLEREAEGEERTTTTDTQDWGATLQLSHQGPILGRGNRVTLGVAYDGHQSRFTQREADADLVLRGNSVGTSRTGDFATEVDVDTRQHNIGVYLTDTFEIFERVALTLAGRYQHVHITIRDRSDENPALNGDHDFDRFSPAVGVTFKAHANLTLFASYSEGFRTPTPAELTCADPNAPCNLPNAFLADPPLKPVIARTYEFGARGTLSVGRQLQWSTSFFRTDLEDDLLFTIVETGGGGFFQNVDRARRQGVEAGVSGEWSWLKYFVNYAYVDATYETDETLASVTAAGGVQVQAGDRIPGIPRHNLKLGAEVAILKNLWVGGNVLTTSGSFLRGDDNNSRAQLDGYTLVNLNARYVPIHFLELWARLDNVTNTDYATGGALNFNAFATPIAVERFVAPGPPFAGWVGVRARF